MSAAAFLLWRFSGDVGVDLAKSGRVGDVGGRFGQVFCSAAVDRIV